MAGDWPVHSLGELTVNFDGRRVPVKESERRKGGYPYYGASGIVDWVDDYIFEGEHLLIAEDGENLRTRKTPIAFIADGRFWVNNHAHIVQGNGNAITRFLLYALSATDIGGYLTGSTMPKLTQGNLSRIPLAIPPIDEQQAIAHILGTLDDKIELNRRMIETLEVMARAFFSSWFERLDAAYEKASALIESGILEVGDGYRAKNSELSGSGLPFIRAGNLNDGLDTEGADLLGTESVAKVGSKVGRTGDVAFTSKGTIGRFARVTEHTPPFVYSPQVCYWRSLDSDQLHPAVLYCWMLSTDFLTQVHSVSGQTDMAPYVSLRDQRAMNVPRFPASQRKVAVQIDPLLRRQSVCRAETKSLAALRDTLLPKLISGELRVKDAERFVERAV